MILDVILILIAFIIIVASYKRGFLRSIILIAGYVASIIVAVVFSKLLSPWIFNTFMRNGIIENINGIVENTVGSANIPQVITEFFETLPQFLISLIDMSFGGNDTLVANIESSTNGMIANIGTAIADVVIMPLIVMLLQSILCIVIFLICLFIVKGVSSLFKSFYEVPILGKVNAVLGGVIGIGIAFVWLFILMIILKTIISFTGNSLTYLNTEVVEKTYIFKWLYQLKFI